jgi:5-methylcytosine-specific restriction protein A
MQPCPDHVKVAWADSKRRDLTDSRYRGARGVRRAHFVIDKADGICHVCGLGGADQADHVIPLSEGGADDLSNLAPIHRIPCHREKTANEAARARGIR